VFEVIDDLALFFSALKSKSKKRHEQFGQKHASRGFKKKFKEKELRSQCRQPLVSSVSNTFHSLLSFI
jgi:hypothetical protein